MIARLLLAALAVLLGAAPALAAYECFRVTNQVSAAFVTQSRIYEQDTQILADAARGNGVQWSPGACRVTQRAAGANMSVDVAACTVVSEGATASVTSGNVVVSAADATNPRIDIISATNAGVKAITAGTPASQPIPPTIPQSGGANNIVLAFVHVPATDTAITNSQITDKRMCVNAPGTGTGTVTHSGALTSEAVIVGNGGADVKVAPSLTSNASGLTSIGTGVPGTFTNPTDFTDIVVAGVDAKAQSSGVMENGFGTTYRYILRDTNNVDNIVARTDAIRAGADATAGWSLKTAIAGALGERISVNNTGGVALPSLASAGTQCVQASSTGLLSVTGSACGAGGGGDFSSNTATSVDSEVVLFSGTGGKTGKRATGTGPAKLAAGVLSASSVNLGTEVTGDLPYANLTPATAASRFLCRGSAGGAGDWQECDLAAGLTVSGTTLTPGFTASSTDALTNKTLDAEGTGNVVKAPFKVWVPAAGCDNATAGTVYDQPTSNGGTAACYGTSPMRFGALNYIDGANALTSQVSLHLPSDWDSAQAVDVKFLWFSGSTSTNSVVWTLATSCVADSEDLLAPTFNTAQTVADANLATANQRNSASITSATMTGCAAGELLFLRVGRDPTNGSDSLAATAALIGVEVTFRRSL